MARTIRNAKIDTRSARAKLSVDKSVHWVSLTRGHAFGYRKGAKGGVWVAKHIGSQGRREATLGPADDALDADGETILSYAQAQEKARAWFASLTAPPALCPVTVEEACRRYVARLETDARTARDAEIRLAKHVIPQLGGRPVATLTLADLETWRNAMIHRTPDDEETARRSKDSANRVINYLKAALNRLLLDDQAAITDDRAWRRLKRFKDVGRVRTVHFDQRQVARLLDATTGGFRRLVTGALLTGGRLGELAALRVGDFDPSTGTLFMRAGKTGPRHVVLTKEGERFFASLCQGRDRDAFLLLRDDNTQWRKSAHHREMKKAIERADLPSGSCFYSLRHTYASECLMAGINLQLLAKNMGTSVLMIERHYGKFTDRARHQQIEAAAPKLRLDIGKGRRGRRRREPSPQSPLSD